MAYQMSLTDDKIRWYIMRLCLTRNSQQKYWTVLGGFKQEKVQHFVSNFNEKVGSSEKHLIVDFSNEIVLMSFKAMHATICT